MLSQLVLYIYRLIVILGVDYYLQKKFLWIGFRKSGVHVCVPLHRSSYTISVAKIIIVTHTNFISSIENWGPRKSKEKNIHQLHFSSVILQQRCQSSPDAKIYSCASIASKDAIHVISLFICYHF